MHLPVTKEQILSTLQAANWDELITIDRLIPA
jgi:hypothetical protein